MPIDPVSTSSVLVGARRAGSRPAEPAAGGAAEAGSGSFTDSLVGVLAKVDRTAGEANDAIANMVRGTGDVHEAMIALQRAESTLQLTVQVRNKLVQAYQDIMRMPI
ncbi:MAG: flagellar hook-basal body complex protein FliE [Acidobacteria bacterium]|nr:flagellar hook-basal body complex protein FliE [Acidobacteriota bacterium]